MRAYGIPLRGLDGAVTRVLIVTCEYEPADALRVALEHGFDYEVRVATGIFEAGLLARQTRPHVILLDCTLPGLNPKEMRLALRSDPELVATRVVAVEPNLSEEQVRGGSPDPPRRMSPARAERRTHAAGSVSSTLGC